MTNGTPNNWHAENQRALLASLAGVRAALQRHIARARSAPEEAPEAPEAAPPAPTLAQLSATFGLSPFERDVLLLCAGVELDAALAALCAEAQGDPQRAFPTFSLALAALPGAHWSALTPAAPLRRWRLIEVGSGASLTLSPLRIDERILHYLAGVPCVDERLAGIVTPVAMPDELVPSHRALAERLAASWARGAAVLPAIQLCGDDPGSKRAIAAAACAAHRLNLGRVVAQALPTSPGDLEALARIWEREAVLSRSALMVDCEELDANETQRATAVNWLVERLSGAVIISTRDRRQGLQRPVVTLDVQKPLTDEQRAVWQAALGPAAQSLNGQIDHLVAQFNLGTVTIRSASAEALARATAEGDGLARELWETCRQQARTRLDDLAQRMQSSVGWDDLVLPEPQRQILRDIAAHVRQRFTVYERWGFAAKGARGLGISALFAGVSGTGKTLAAEVLANELRLDLYRIDLSSVVSKYIGETEKNLRRIFDAAEEGGAILLFDEADALFGKRSEVKDSHDRYANIEVGYLLQRMEAYRGLAILTTNLKSSIDTAFLRRIRFVVQFPFPDIEQRAAIWERIFPPDAPTEGLDARRLAQVNVAGGNIRNIALNAAFLAADESAPVRMIHVLRAARAEYAKLEKPLTDAEIAGWI